MRTIIYVHTYNPQWWCIINAISTHHHLTPRTSLKKWSRMSLQESKSVQRKGKRKIMESSCQGLICSNQSRYATCLSLTIYQAFYYSYITFHSSTLHLSIGPRKTKSAAPKGLREVNVQRWEQKRQLPQNWGHSNGENKIQDIINKWSYMPKTMTMNICIPLI